MSRRRPEDLITETQRTFAQKVRERLNAASVSFSERIEATRAEAWYIFHIHTDPDLNVQVVVVDDTFSIEAHGAVTFRDRAAWPDDNVGAWIAECTHILDALLRGPLQVRVYRTLLGRTHGAIWVHAENGTSGWSGELAACRGKGAERIFPARWYKSTAD
jgi:hypothetical protein